MGSANAAAKRMGATGLVRSFFDYIGEDGNRPGLRETPARVVHAWDYLYSGYKYDPKDILKQFEDEAPITYNQMVLLKDIEFYSTCEHHVLPFFGKAHVAYIPTGKKVVGVSKLARLVDCFSRRLQTQERICQEVTQTLDEVIQSAGSACILEASHFCMMCRGVEKQHSKMITSSLTGAFLAKPEARMELLTLIRG